MQIETSRMHQKYIKTGSYSSDEQKSALLLQKLSYFFHLQLLVIDQCIDINEDGGRTLESY